MKTVGPRESLEAYYHEAGSWAIDRQDMLRSSRRTAWIVAAVALATTLIALTALMLLTPLKTVEPYTLLVDRNTGYVQALKPLEANQISATTALTQSFLVQYVIARESFDIDELQSNYKKVALWSADQARSDYLASVQISNPGSPLSRYPRTTMLAVRVKSVSLVGQNVAFVRFDAQRRDAGGQPGPVRSWLAVIRYRFSTEPLEQSDRLINPLGFQVLRYHRDQEQVPSSIEPEPIFTPGSTATQSGSLSDPTRPANSTTTARPIYPQVVPAPRETTVQRTAPVPQNNGDPM